MGQAYAGAYFSPETRTQVEEIALNVKAAFRARIVRLDWLDERTRTEALRKLDAYVIEIGYPTNMRDYSTLHFQEKDLLGNVLLCARSDWHDMLAHLGAPVDRREWLETPQSADALHTGWLRQVIFPAGFLLPPVFDPSADAAINYGAVGAVIGHELTHGFDTKGSALDSAGELRILAV